MKWVLIIESFFLASLIVSACYPQNFKTAVPQPTLNETNIPILKSETTPTFTPHPSQTFTPFVTITPYRSPTPTPAKIPDCPSNIKAPILETTPLRVDDITAIVPLGNLNPTGHVFPTDHIYIYFDKEAVQKGTITKTVPIFAPAHGWITMISSSEHLSEKPTYTDYDLHFSTCAQVTFFLGHVSSLTDRISQKIKETIPGRCQSYTTGGKDYKNCQYTGAIEIQSSEQIGSTGGNPGLYAFDFGAYDYRQQPLAFANPSRQYKDQLHAVCPLDFLTTNIYAQLKSRIGKRDGSLKRTTEPLCGQVVQDIPGSSQGIWFKKGTTKSNPEDPHLALVHDNVDERKPLFSVGNSIKGLTSRVYEFLPLPSGNINRDFSAIKANDEIYCFEGTGRLPMEIPTDTIIILQLVSDTQLRIEKQTQVRCGKGPWKFTNNSVDFER